MYERVREREKERERERERERGNHSLFKAETVKHAREHKVVSHKKNRANITTQQQKPRRKQPP